MPYPTEEIPFAVDGAAGPYRVLLGPGTHALTEPGVFRYLGEQLDLAAQTIRAATAQIAGAHEGAAADATRLVLTLLEDAAHHGREEALRADRAILDQAEYFRHVRDAVAALPQPTGSVSPLLPDAVINRALLQHATDKDAVDIAETFRGNANSGFGSGFRAFESPPVLQIDTAPGPAPAAGGGAVEGLRGTDPVTLSPAAAPPGPVIGGVTHPGTAGASPADAGVAGHNSSAGAGASTAAGPAPVPLVPAASGPGSVNSASRPGAVPPALVPRPPSGPIPPPGLDQPLGPLPGGQPARPRLDRPPATAPPQSPVPARPGVPQRAPAEIRTAPGLPQARPGLAPGPGPGPQAGGRGAGTTHVPLLPGTGGGSSEAVHERPGWLYEDDADAVWFAGLPHHVDPVVSGRREPGGSGE